MWVENAPIITQCSTYDLDRNSSLPLLGFDPDTESQVLFLQRLAFANQKRLALGHFLC